jgi:quercetin dioxygenase-like cupin family protein
MKSNDLLDPSRPELSREVEGALAERLAPLPPPPAQARSLRERLMQRVHTSLENGRAIIHVPLAEGEWRALVPGVRVKCLAEAQRAFLLDLAPGASLPFHRHHEDEECVVLRGSAELGGIEVRAGDYHLAPAGSRHGVVRSEAGALLFLRGVPIGHGGEVLRDLAGALLPGAGAPLLTQRAEAARWQPRAGGGESWTLRDDAGGRALMLRLAAGEALTLAARTTPSECLLLAGEAFFPERLMGAGDYRLAPADGRSDTVSSDVGALIFLREEALAADGIPGGGARA